MGGHVCEQFGLGFEQELGHGEVGLLSAPSLSLFLSFLFSVLILFFWVFFFCFSLFSLPFLILSFSFSFSFSSISLCRVSVLLFFGLLIFCIFGLKILPVAFFVVFFVNPSVLFLLCFWVFFFRFWIFVFLI